MVQAEESEHAKALSQEEDWHMAQKDQRPAWPEPGEHWEDQQAGRALKSTVRV